MFEIFLQGIRYLPHDAYLAGLTIRTLRLAIESTAIAALLGFPLACVLGLGRSRVSRWSLVVANAGMGLPPVAVGVFGLLILAGRPTPWGGRWDSMNGMVLAQTVLALPIVIGLGAIAIRRLPEGLLDQGRAFGATGWRLGVFALREARVGAVAAVILAMGSAFAEVGAVTLIGGNSIGVTATLASQVINDISGSQPGAAVEHLIVLFGLMLALGAIFTAVQQWDGRAARGGPQPRVRATWVRHRYAAPHD